MKRFLFWMKGYVLASIPKENTERFINILPNHNIRAYQVSIRKERCFFRMGRRDYLSLLPIARKTGSYPRMHQKRGAYFLWRWLLRHNGLIFGVLLFGILVYVLSLFVWSIEFEGNSLHTSEQLLRLLSDRGIGFGSRCDHIDCNALEADIRKQYSDISWVSVELTGSRMTVRVKEAGFSEKKEAKEQQPSHIVAEENGIIADMIVRNGTAQVSIGDTVKKGDVLISGLIETKDEYGERIATTPVVADGEVKLRTEVVYFDREPLAFSKKEPTGRQKNGYSLSLFCKKIFSYIPSIPYERYDIITTSATWKISKNLYLPISHDTISCMEYVEREAIHSNAWLSETCHRRYLSRMEDYLAAGYRMISEAVALRIIDTDCCLQGTVTLEGPFWSRCEVSSKETKGVLPE